LAEEAEAEVRLTWSKEPNESGLAKVCQLPRGAILKLNGKQIATVHAYTEGFSRELRGWYWYGGDEAIGVPRKNTASAPLKELADAKAQAEIYVRTCLGLPLKRLK
jgi:hypothetical protein